MAFSLILVAGAVTFAGGQTPKMQRKNLSSQESTGLENYSGVVTDTTCGARHSQQGDMSSGECARACVRNGARYSLVSGDQSYFLEGRGLNKVAGQRVRISGTRDGDTIRVVAITSP